ncbi:hypothetical protein GCM10018963_63620 [Saccharothrix longispora]
MVETATLVGVVLSRHSTLSVEDVQDAGDLITVRASTGNSAASGRTKQATTAHHAQHGPTRPGPGGAVLCMPTPELAAYLTRAMARRARSSRVSARAGSATVWL